GLSNSEATGEERTGAVSGNGLNRGSRIAPTRVKRSSILDPRSSILDHTSILTNLKATPGARILPIGLCPDQICARADISDAMARPVDPGAVESDAVVADFNDEVGRILGAHFHLHLLRFGVPADVVERFLDNPVKLNPFDVRESQAIFQIRLADEFVGEFLFRWQLRHGVAQGPFERGQEA